MSADPPLSFGLVEDRPVFMDEATDTYFLLEDAQEQEFLDCSAHRTPGFSPHLEETLGANPLQVAFARCERPTSAILGSNPPAAGVRATDVARIARLLVHTRRAIGRKPIAAILTELRQPRASPDEPHDTALVQASAIRFLTARRVVPVRNNCLLDSIALVRWLGAGGSPATLVFGVKLHPFAAHCWVQSGALLVNDRLETVHRFTPVRVIRCAPGTP
jgi:hypothetical protein